MGESAAVSWGARWSYVGLAVFVAAMWFAILPSRPLFNPDEGRYAEIPREMLRGGDWVIPHLNGVVYIEKPPLQYWATALSLRVFGQNEFGARFYTALCALGTLTVVWWAAAGLWGEAAAWRTAAVLASSMLFVVLGQLLTLDMSLTFYMTLALAAFLLAQSIPVSLPALRSQPQQPLAAPSLSQPQDFPHALPPAPPLPLQRTPRDAQRARFQQRRLMWVAWAATALGVLTKGLVAAAIPAAVLLSYSLYSRDFGPWRRLHLPSGLPLFLAIAVPWHWLAARRLPDFLQFFFVHEHLSRYLTPSADREEAWWFFGAVFVLGSLPWAFSACRVAAVGWRRNRGQLEANASRFDPKVFLWIWVAFVCVFFSFSDSKLIPYILPAMPAVALLIAASSAKTLARDIGYAAVFTVLAGIGLAAASIWGTRLLSLTDRNQYFSLLARPLAQIAVLLAVSGIAVLGQRRRDLTRAAVFLGVGWCLAGMLLMRAAAVVAPVYSGITLARALGVMPPDEPFYSVATYDQTLPFYAQRTLQLVTYRGELDFGLRHDPGLEIASLTGFIGEWQNVPEGYAVMETSMFDDLKLRGVPMREVARDVRRVLVARR